MNLTAWMGPNHDLYLDGPHALRILAFLFGHTQSLSLRRSGSESCD